ncbi:MAG TPA: hypothetical protein VFN31_01285 [Candidatus Saccharimonadales bacterium]|nr:hypothetical protein [Candidatus Saccharimonadales bacterium]
MNEQVLEQSPTDLEQAKVDEQANPITLGMLTFAGGAAGLTAYRSIPGTARHENSLQHTVEGGGFLFGGMTVGILLTVAAHKGLRGLKRRLSEYRHDDRQQEPMLNQPIIESSED